MVYVIKKVFVINRYHDRKKAVLIDMPINEYKPKYQYFFADFQYSATTSHVVTDG
jgi:hypothetical protein